MNVKWLPMVSFKSFANQKRFILFTTNILTIKNAENSEFGNEWGRHFVSTRSRDISLVTSLSHFNSLPYLYA